MTRPSAEQKLVPSLLDRLLDDQPKVSQEVVGESARYVVQAKDAVKRDLEWLLNSKQVVADLPVDLREVRKSVLTHGLPDFTALSLSNLSDQALLRRSIEEAIGRFEPRLSQVAVTLEELRPLDRSLRFRIDALLRVEPEPEPVTFDSVLQLNTKAFSVRGESA